jgi:hypothetical protein
MNLVGAAADSHHTMRADHGPAVVNDRLTRSGRFSRGVPRTRRRLARIGARRSPDSAIRQEDIGTVQIELVRTAEMG